MSLSLQTKSVMSIVALCTSWIPIIGWLYTIIVLFISLKTMGSHESEKEFKHIKKILLRAFIAVILIPISFILYGVLGFLGLRLFGM
ncbi:MAG: hypothetical protein ACOCQQ_00565 [Candidatus Nanoarchaeia archaeon]